MGLNRYAALPAMMAIGIAVGIVTEKSVNAQNPPPAYYVAEHVVSDPEAFKPYAERVPATIEKYGGRFIARGGKVDTLEGDAPKGRVVLIAFKSLADARRWYESPEYREIIDIRHRAAKSRIFVVEGLPTN